jgi:hypothetical protein
MKHPSTRELFDYWNARRGRRLAPERDDIEPSHIRRILADTFIFAFDEGKGHPFRLAGTRVCALFGRELKGEAFMRLWAAESRALVRDLVTAVAEESVGVIAGASAVSHDGSALDLELLTLPLVHRSRTDVRVLGALTPAEAPNWVGSSVLHDLVLGTLRYVGLAVRLSAPPHLSPLPNGQVRHGLVVYEGGNRDRRRRQPISD